MKRYFYIVRTALILTLCGLAFVTQAQVKGVAAAGMTVSEMGRAIDFYSALTFQKVSDLEVLGDDYDQLVGIFGVRMRIVRMQLGNEFVDLTEYLTPRGRPVPEDSRSNDLWFQHIAIVVSDMDKAFDQLRALKVQFVSTSPQRLPDWNKGAAGVKAFYFRDPDRHNLEIINFPPGKGDGPWQQKTDKLFLGIDHSAIAVANTDASLRFYSDLLGFRKTGESENYGTEQEHLNQIFGAHLRITSMHAGSGPGIEFLEYLTSRDGRPRARDAKANDLIHWQTMLVTRDLEAVVSNLRAERVDLVSSGLTVMPKGELGFSKGTLIRDPDGHAILLVEE